MWTRERGRRRAGRPSGTLATRRLAAHVAAIRPQTLVGRSAASAPASSGPLAKLIDPAARGRGRSTTGCARATAARSLMLTLVIVAVGVVQARGTGLRRYAAFRIALRTETDLRQRLFAHLQRLHFAFHDQAQTGQLMARANTDIQQINQCVILDPAHAGELSHDGRRARDHGDARARCSRCSRSARSRSSTSPRRGSRDRIAPGRPRAAGGARRPLGRRRGERRRRPRREGLRRRAHAGASGSRPRPTSVLDRSLAAAQLRAGFLPLVDFLPDARRWSAILWYGGHQVLDGKLAGRRHRRLQPLHPHADLAAADGRHAARAGVARVGRRAGRVHEILVTDPEIADPPTRRAAAARAGRGDASRACSFGYGAGPAGARRPRPRRSAAARRSRSSARRAAARPRWPG